MPIKKYTYYYINNKGEKTKARTSANEYLFGLIHVGKDGIERCTKCSIRKDIIEQEIKYILKHGTASIDDLRIADLFKE